MASKIIMFPSRESQSGSNTPRPGKSTKQRAEALPDWLQELDIEWIFQEEERRRNRKNTP